MKQRLADRLDDLLPPTQFLREIGAEIRDEISEIPEEARSLRQRLRERSREIVLRALQAIREVEPSSPLARTGRFLAALLKYGVKQIPFFPEDLYESLEEKVGPTLQRKRELLEGEKRAQELARQQERAAELFRMLPVKLPDTEAYIEKRKQALRPTLSLLPIWQFAEEEGLLLRERSSILSDAQRMSPPVRQKVNQPGMTGEPKFCACPFCESDLPTLRIEPEWFECANTGCDAKGEVFDWFYRRRGCRTSAEAVAQVEVRMSSQMDRLRRIAQEIPQEHPTHPPLSPQENRASPRI